MFPCSKKRVCRTDGYSLVASFEPLVHRWNVASLSVFFLYYFGTCKPELPEQVSLPHSRGRSTCYSKSVHDFSVTIPIYYKDVYVNCFFARTGRLWNSRSPERFPLNYKGLGLILS